MTNIVTCAICDRTFDIDTEGGFTSRITNKSVCDACSRENPEESARLMIKRWHEHR